MKVLLLMSFLFVTTQLFAQTEASMCVSVTDACCDGNWSSVDYLIPAGQQITTTYIHFDSPKTPSSDGVEIQCLGFPNGEPGVVIWEYVGGSMKCNCGNASHSEIMAGPSQIRFKVRCKGCNSDNCTLGSSPVNFYTSARPTCPPNCAQQ